MADTPSAMLPLGTSAPAFQLPDTTADRVVSIEPQRGGRAIELRSASGKKARSELQIDFLSDGA